MSIAERLLTAEEFQLLPNDGPSELVRGKIVPMNRPGTRHGIICSNIDHALRCHLDQNDVGRVTINDAGVITERAPDTVRGADVAYYSYNRLPRSPIPDGYVQVMPELVFEVLSPSDRRPKVLEKIAEYLNAGVLIVCVVDPDAQTAHVYSADRPDYIIMADQDLEFPELLPGFRIQVGRLFR